MQAMINEKFVKYYDRFGALAMALIMAFTIGWLFWDSDFKPILFGYPKPNIQVEIFSLCSLKNIAFWVLNLTWVFVLLKVVEFKSKSKKQSH